MIEWHNDGWRAVLAPRERELKHATYVEAHVLAFSTAHILRSMTS